MSRCKDPRGFVKLWRKSKDSAHYSMSLLHIGLFEVLLLEAAWNGRRNYKGERMGPGQWGFTVKGLAVKFNISQSHVRRLLRYFEENEMIQLDSRNNRWTKYTILNWDEYQGEDEEKNQRRTESGPGLEITPNQNDDSDKPATNHTGTLRKLDDTKPTNRESSESVSGLDFGGIIIPTSDKPTTNQRRTGDEPAVTYEEDKEHRIEEENTGGKPPSLFPGVGQKTIPDCPYESIKDFWNSLCEESGLSKIQSLNKTRKDKLRKWWKEDWFRNSLKSIIQTWHEDPFRIDNSRSAGTFDNFLAGTSSNNPLLYFEKMMAKKQDKPSMKKPVLTIVRTPGGLKGKSFDSEEEMNRILSDKGYVYSKSMNQWALKEEGE